MIQRWVHNRFLPMAFSTYFYNIFKKNNNPPPSGNYYVETQNNSISYVTPNGDYYVQS